MITLALRLAAPGWSWVPPVLRSARYWRLVGRFALWGPLIGGAPYALLVFTVPFIYLIGVIPALLAGMLFAAWLFAPARRHPSAAWRAAVGMLCGAAACAVVALVFDERTVMTTWTILALHGVPAALVLALRQRAPRPAATGARSPAGTSAERIWPPAGPTT